MSFCFYKFHQEFAGKIGKDAETAFLLLPGVGWRTRMASTEEKLHGASFLFLILILSFIQSIISGVIQFSQESLHIYRMKITNV